MKFIPQQYEFWKQELQRMKVDEKDISLILDSIQKTASSLLATQSYQHFIIHLALGTYLRVNKVVPQAKVILPSSPKPSLPKKKLRFKKLR